MQIPQRECCCLLGLCERVYLVGIVPGWARILLDQLYRWQKVTSLLHVYCACACILCFCKYTVVLHFPCAVACIPCFCMHTVLLQVYCAFACILCCCKHTVVLHVVCSSLTIVNGKPLKGIYMRLFGEGLSSGATRVQCREEHLLLLLFPHR